MVVGLVVIAAKRSLDGSVLRVHIALERFGEVPRGLPSVDVLVRMGVRVVRLRVKAVGLLAPAELARGQGSRRQRGEGREAPDAPPPRAHGMDRTAAAMVRRKQDRGTAAEAASLSRAASATIGARGKKEKEGRLCLSPERHSLRRGLFFPDEDAMPTGSSFGGFVWPMRLCTRPSVRAVGLFAESVGENPHGKLRY